VAIGVLGVPSITEENAAFISFCSDSGRVAMWHSSNKEFGHLSRPARRDTYRDVPRPRRAEYGMAQVALRRIVGWSWRRAPDADWGVGRERPADQTRVDVGAATAK